MIRKHSIKIECKRSFIGKILQEVLSPQKLLLIILLSLSSIYSYAQDESNDYISFSSPTNSFAIVSNKTSRPIVLAAEEYSGVKKVATLFQSDIRKVTQSEPQIFFNEIPQSKEIIIIGTIGKSNLIEKLISEGKLDVSNVKGKWDNALIQTVEHPFKGIEKALVIAGSNKRGTIYGMFDISRKIGVSPWYWWADVPVKKHEEIFVKSGLYNLGEPKVKYRGIFLNDEEPALGRWAVKNYDGFNHEFYDKVFELILRLKGNFLWPAMWWASFNSDDPLNPKLADEMGIVMSTSHHEPMMRAHAEWKPYGGGEWNFATNTEQLKKFWEEGIERMNGYESVVTLAMRGDGDMAMSAETNTALLEKIVNTQREIIKDVTGKHIEETPQVWALYKEVQEYYDKGMRVPDDVTLLLCDDNWGNIRVLPKLEEEKRKGGYGIYYHFDFVGGPRNYKWLNTSPLPRIWEQLNLAYNYGVDRIWLVNVGDLKPMELPISFFLDYAWNPDAMTTKKLHDYTTNWAKEQFGEQHAEEIGEILRLYPKYNARRKPESLFSDTYSLTNYREFESIVSGYKRLELVAKQIYDKQEDNYKDAFYQFVYHPVLACSNLNEMYYAHAKNLLYAKQGRASTNDIADKVKNLFEKDMEITEYYHTKLAKGKWNHMMAQTHIGYDNWQQPEKNRMPKVEKIKIPENGELGVAIEGSDKLWPDEKSSTKLPAFDSFNQQSFFIELFNRGQELIEYQLLATTPWVVLSTDKGSVEKEDRITVSVNWKKTKPGQNTAKIKIISGENEVSNIEVLAINYEGLDAEGFIENNGYFSIEATNCTKANVTKDIRWEGIPSIGRTSNGITAMPVTNKIEKPGGKSPSLEYDFYLLEKPKNGALNVNFYVSPTLNFLKESGLHFGVSIDNEPIQLVNLHEGTEIPDWKYPNWWNQAVLNNIMVKTSEHKITETGKHTLKYWLVDPGIVLQKIVIDAGGLKQSYLGPPESLKID